MKNNKRSKYKTPFSVDYRNPVVINSEDPRANGAELDQYRSRLGRKVIVKTVKDISQTITKELEKYISSPILYFKYGVPQNTQATEGYQSYAPDYNPSEIQVDSLGNMFLIYNTIIGTYPNNFISFALVKIDKDANVIWKKIIKPPVSRSMRYHSLILDDSDNVYISASYDTGSFPPIDYQGIIIKLNSDGEFQWARKNSEYAGSNGYAYRGNLSAVGSDESIYSTSNLYYNITKITNDNLKSSQLLWSDTSNEFPGLNAFTYINLIKFKNNSIYVFGYVECRSASFPYGVELKGFPFFMKLNTNLEIVWQKRINLLQQVTNNPRIADVKFDNDNNIYILGYYDDQVFLIKYNESTDTIQNKKEFGINQVSNPGEGVLADSLFIDNNQGIYILLQKYYGSAEYPILLKIKNDFSLDYASSIEIKSTTGDYQIWLTNDNYLSKQNKILNKIGNMLYIFIPKRPSHIGMIGLPITADLYGSYFIPDYEGNPKLYYSNATLLISQITSAASISNLNISVSDSYTSTNNTSITWTSTDDTINLITKQYLQGEM